MKKHHILLSIFIILFPFLLGNAPAPYPFAREYEDYTVTPFVREELAANNFRYTATITNTGDGFISVKDTYVHAGDMAWLEVSGYDFSVILPSKSHTLVYIYETSLDVSLFDLQVRAYTELSDEYTASNFRNITRRALEDGYYMYEYEMDLVVNTNDYYEIVTVFEYAGETYTSTNRHYLDKPCFFSETQMDSIDITITNIYLLQGRSRQYGGGAIYIFIILAVISLIVLGIILIIGVPLLVTLLLIRRHKKKQAV